MRDDPRLIVRLEIDSIVREIACDAGERLLDALDDAGLSSIASCRSANCGVCLVRLRRGAAYVTPPSSSEAETLRVLSVAGPSGEARLSCQLRITVDAPREAELELELVGR